MDKLRIGQFYISEWMIEENPEIVKKIMSMCIIIKAETLLSKKIHYIALSDEFDKIVMGSQIPWYRCTAETKGAETVDDVLIVFKKKDTA